MEYINQIIRGRFSSKYPPKYRPNYHPNILFAALALTAIIAGIAIAASPVYKIETLATPRTGNMSTQFMFVINITNIGDHNLTNINVTANYTSLAFSFVSANPAPSSYYNNSINWTNVVTNLQPNASFLINVTLLARNLTTRMNATFNVSSYATNGTDPAAASSSTEVEILWYNLIPYFTTTPILNATVGANYTYDVDATDPNGDALAFTLQAAPAGMQINSSTGLILWAPNSTQNGTWNVAVNASDGMNGSAIQAYNLTVYLNTTTNGTNGTNGTNSTNTTNSTNYPPNITTTPGVDATVGVNYTYPAGATDLENETVRFNLTVYPLGMTIDTSNGWINWVPNSSQVGLHNVTLNASDNNGSSIQSWTINVTLNTTGNTTNGTNTTNSTNATNYPPNITTTPTTNGTVNATYIYDANATDYENETITWNLTQYPPGMTVNSSTGLISWTPNSTQAGLFNITLNAIDPNGTTNQNWTINISGVPNYKPNITSPGVLNATEDAFFQYNITAFDPENGTLTYRLANAPSGMAINNATGAINWTPNNSQVGINTFVVNVTDNQSNSGAINLTINVTNTPPSFTSTPGTSVVATTVYIYDANSTDDGQGNVTYGLFVAPVGMSINATSGLVTWPPTSAQIGNNTVILVVNDGNGGLTNQTFNVTATTPLYVSFTGPAYQNMSTLANYTMFARNMGNYSIQNVTINLYYNYSDMNISGIGAVVYNGNYSVTNPLINLSNQSGLTTVDRAFNLSPYSNASITLTLLLFNKSANWSNLTANLTNWTTNLAVFANAKSNETGLIENASLNTTIIYVNYAPYFTSTPPTAVIVTTLPYGYQASAYDANGDTLTFALMIAPGGMTINSTTGTINWTPTLLQTGMINVTINASDGKGGWAVQSYTINSTRYNSPPTITTTIAPNATEDAAYSFDINATDNENDTVTWMLDLAVDSMTINSASGVVSWTPNNTRVGNATFRVNASDGMGNLTQYVFAMFVLNNPPGFTTTPAVTAIHGVEYTYDANSNDDWQGNITYWLTASPAAMTVNITTGVVSWTPALWQVGLNNVTLRVLDGNGGIGEQNFTINVSSALIAAAGAYPQPVQMSQQVNVTVNATSIGSRTMSNLTLGIWYNTSDLTFVGSSPASSGAAVNGSMPFTNLSFNLANSQTGAVVLAFLAMNRTASWNTTVMALFNASDNGTIVGQNTSARVGISFVNFAPQITSSPATTAYVNNTYVYNVNATDGNGDILSYNLTVYPANMTINNATGVINWTPAAAGNFSVTVQVYDGRGGSAAQSWSLESRILNYGPNITTSPGFLAVEDFVYTYDVNATDLNGDIITYYLMSGPAGMTINSSTGLVAFTALNYQVGSAVVTVRAMDPYGINDSQSWTLTINNNPPNITTSPTTTVAERMNYTYDVNSTDDGQGTIAYYLDLAPSGMIINSTTGIVGWSPTTGQAGLSNVSVRVTDGNGGQAVQNFTINVTDTTPPNVTLMSPANGTAYRNNSANVSFAASDNAGIASCSALINGTVISMYSASGTLNRSVSVFGNISLQQGWNNVTIVCYDNSGLSNASSSIILFTDMIAPVVTISAPVSGGNSSGNATLTYSVSDSTLDKVQILVNGAFALFGNASGVVILNMNEGLGQNITIIANDSVGWNSSATVKFNVDRTAPTARIGAPAAVLLTGSNGAVINVTGVNSSDNLGIAGYAWDFDAADSILNVDAGTQNATKNYTSPGSYAVTLSVNDVAGSIGRSNVSVTVAQDTDADGFPDNPVSGYSVDTCPFIRNSTNDPNACVNDTDGDSVADAVDFIYGNITNVIGNLQGLALVVGSTTNPNTASGLQTITITQNGNNLIQFSWNLTNTTRLYMNNITILRQTGGILIAGLPYPINKTVWLPKDSSAYNAVCVKDVAAQSFAEITSTCTGASEIQVNCTGSNQGKTCTDTGSYFKVANLAYTIITSMTVGGSGAASNTTTTVVTTSNGQAIVTDSGSSGSGGSFDARSGSSSDSSRTVSQSYTPFNAGATEMPSTTPATTEPKATPKVPGLVIVDTGETAAESTTEDASQGRPADSAYYVGSPVQEGALTTVMIVLVIMMGLLVMVAIIAALVWAVRR